MKKYLISSLLLLTGLFGAHVHASEQCMDIGGVAIPNFFAEGEGKPVIISASLIGSVTNAAGKILAQEKTDSGMIMTMEHYFGRQDGGAIYTKDTGILTAIPGRPGRFMIEITYDIQEGKSRGTLTGYKGQFKSYGLVDLRDVNDMQGLVRYAGTLCK